jgi:hypothetical protein
MKKILLFELLFAESREEDELLHQQFKQLGITPGKHPVQVTKDKLLTKIQERAVSTILGRNPHLPNKGKQLTPDEIYQLFTTGEIPDYAGTGIEIDLREILDKPRLKLQVVKELTSHGLYKQEELKKTIDAAREELRQEVKASAPTVAKVIQQKQAKQPTQPKQPAQKINPLSAASNKEIEGLADDFFNKSVLKERKKAKKLK